MWRSVACQHIWIIKWDDTGKQEAVAPSFLEKNETGPEGMVVIWSNNKEN